MWSLEMNWQELIIRAFAVFVFLFIVFRFWGKKHFGELTPFDLVILLIISEAVQNALIADDKSIPAAFITVMALMSFNVFLNKISFYSKKAEKMIDGVPKILIKNGTLNHQLMKSETITDQELHEALRMQGVLDIDDVYLATLETNGSISVIKKKNVSLVSKLFQ